MNQLKAIIAAGTLTGIILVTAIAFGVRGVNALGRQNSAGTTISAPTIVQSEPNQPTFSRQSQSTFGEREEFEYEEWDDD